MIALVILAVALLAQPADADARDRRAVAAFRKANPCPSTGARAGACPGWVVDHVVPLCLGGADDPRNMQWQERQESYIKDTAERAACARTYLSDKGFFHGEN